MNSLVLLLLSSLACSVYSAKVTPEILSCASQIGDRVGSEGNAKVKSTVESLVGNVKSGDFKAVQQALSESDAADRTMAINKYMVDSCTELKTCMVCPLSLS